MSALIPMPFPVCHEPHVEDDFDRMYACADECAPGSRFEVSNCVTVREHGDVFTQCSAIFVDGATGETTDIGITNTWDIRVCARDCGDLEVRGLPKVKAPRPKTFIFVGTAADIFGD